MRRWMKKKWWGLMFLDLPERMKTPYADSQQLNTVLILWRKHRKNRQKF